MKKLGIFIAVVLFGIFVFAQEVDMETLLNRIELLEEYTNMIYDVLGTKVSSDELETVLDELETVLAELDGRISELETKVLNIQSTIDTGLPALRDMLYELFANLAAVEERLTSYIEVSLLTIKDEAKAEVMDEILSMLDDIKVTLDIHDSDILKIYDTLGTLSEQIAAVQEKLASFMDEIFPMLDDIKVTLDIHDSDILKIYDTLGTLSEQIAALQEKLASFEEISASIELLTLKLDMHDQDIVNIYDNLSMKADREQVDALEASVADALENAKKDLQAKIDTKADAKAVEEKVNNVNMIAWIGVVLGAVALVLPFVRGQ
jgi:chaperonin cofactor prefoldin